MLILNHFISGSTPLMGCWKRCTSSRCIPIPKRSMCSAWFGLSWYLPQGCV